MKRLKTVLCTLFLASGLFLLLASGAGASGMRWKELTVYDAGSVLEEGIVYEVLTDTTIINTSAGGSGLVVAENSNVCIFVKKGATLTVKGGAGDHGTGGGAGILVPRTSRLVLAGEGTVIATGGDAGDGQDGERGSAAVVSREGNYYYGGKGGKGGAGGGGAGAGIGTAGGKGGTGTDNASYSYLYRRLDETYALRLTDLGVIASVCEPDAGDTCGTDGTDGDPGKAADMPGSIFVIGALTVEAYSGKAGAHGEAGIPGLSADSTPYGWQNIYAAGGGGGGGAGHGGYEAAAGIGPGGSGGGAGGQGGSGGTYWSASEVVFLAGGQGGFYNDESGSGLSTSDPVIKDSTWGGFGGAGGKPETNTESFALEIGKDSTVTGAPDNAVYTFFNPLDTRLTFVSSTIDYRDMGSDTFSGTKTGSFVTGYLLGESVILPREAYRAGYNFGGWYRDPGCLDGPVTMLDYEWGIGEHPVYAKWTAKTERTEDEEGGPDLSLEMKIAICITGFVVAVSFFIFLIMRTKHQEKIRNRKVHR